MYSFKNDYSEGCHPRILEALSKANLAQCEGYGDDTYSIEAKNLIKGYLNNNLSEIFFVSGGTQANLIVISSMLRPHEAVISATSGHIAMHEAGAIEATGHKVITVDSADGKLRVEHLKSVLLAHSDVPHMVKPKMVYISNSTEVGTVYRKQELIQLSKFCKEHNLYLFMDGARLASALASSECDITLADLAQLTDVFYIGGTKSGALLGEAIVINNPHLQIDFSYHIKQKGALLAKGQLIGIQFLVLFQRNLIFNLAHQANAMAAKLTKGFMEGGFPFLTTSVTNQIFPILPNSVIALLQERYSFYVWSRVDETSSSIRLVTSWATTDEAVEMFLSDLSSLSLA